MNGLVGSSLYDSLNKMVIGFLILLPFLLLPEVSGVCLLSRSLSSCDLFVLLFSWIIGIFFWALCELFLVRIFGIFLPSVFKRNNIKWINQVYKDILEKIPASKYNNITELTDTDYLTIYYVVQRHGLLGNVPILESFSVFFRNFIIVSVIWIFLLLIFLICPYNLPICEACDCTCVRPILFSILMIILVLDCICIFARRKTEMNIFHLIIESYGLAGLTGLPSAKPPVPL